MCKNQRCVGPVFQSSECIHPTRMIRSTIEELCSTSQWDKQFEQQYLKVLEATQRIIKKAKTDKKEEPFFREMFLYLAEDLQSTVAKLPCNQKDPILWQVCHKYNADLYVHACMHGSMEATKLMASMHSKHITSIGCQNGGTLP